MELNHIVAEQIYRMQELRRRYQRMFIHRLNNFYHTMGNI